MLPHLVQQVIHLYAPAEVSPPATLNEVFHDVFLSIGDWLNAVSVFNIQSPDEESNVRPQ